MELLLPCRELDDHINSATADCKDNDAASRSTRASCYSGRSIPTCNYCKTCEGLEVVGWTECPHLKPGQKRLIVKSRNDVTNEDDEHICGAVTTALLDTSHRYCELDFEATAHVAYKTEVSFKR